MQKTHGGGVREGQDLSVHSVGLGEPYVTKVREKTCPTKEKSVTYQAQREAHSTEFPYGAHWK